MCIICVDLDNHKLSPWEASKNLSEMIDQIDEDHIEEVDEKIAMALIEFMEGKRHCDL
jgi:hypothetical protein